MGRETAHFFPYCCVILNCVTHDNIMEYWTDHLNFILGLQ